MLHISMYKPRNYKFKNKKKSESQILHVHVTSKSMEYQN